MMIFAHTGLDSPHMLLLLSIVHPFQALYSKGGKPQVCGTYSHYSDTRRARKAADSECFRHHKSRYNDPPHSL
jgi:hypothetical protein